MVYFLKRKVSHNILYRMDFSFCLKTLKRVLQRDKDFFLGLRQVTATLYWIEVEHFRFHIQNKNSLSDYFVGYYLLLKPLNRASQNILRPQTLLNAYKRKNSLRPLNFTIDKEEKYLRPRTGGHDGRVFVTVYHLIGRKK